MFGSIVDDIKTQFRSGNMITRLILLNVIIWAVMALVKSFAPTAYLSVVNVLAIPGDAMTLLIKPWTLVTHMFVHAGFWHLFWNMLVLYWFGRVVGDLIGDRHILPLYFAGGLAGAVAYFLSYQAFGEASIIGAYAVGASAAIMAIVMAAGRVAPDYIMNLILIGPVRLKFIVLALIFMDIIGVGGQSNTGGHIAHLAGVGMGWIFVSQLGSRGSISDRFNALFDWFSRVFSGTESKTTRKSPLTVKYKSDAIKRKSNNTLSLEDRVDQILDKIKKSGYDSLSSEEREILAKASKK